MSSSIHTEKTFETAIEDYLLEAHGYLRGSRDGWSRELALDREHLFAFLQESQPAQWQQLEKIHGAAEVKPKLLQRLFKELDTRGTLDVLRHGIVDYGVRLRMSYFKPPTALNEETLRLYHTNRLTVTRQVKYSTRHENSVDLMLCLNGLPIVTAELKSHFTHQNVQDAKRQYMQNRDARELFFQFKKRALVHFAIDPDEVFMTTRLRGTETRFLPFNQGDRKGAGNPPREGNYKTAYLWEEIWSKDSLLEIIARFMHLQVEEFTVDQRKAKRETLIFPRYHQLDVVRKLERAVKEIGAGRNYLVQHSAGSGKSNSIAWLAHGLAALHSVSDQSVFDSVIVITDRVLLDQQLQETIYQFEHKQGVVARIDEDSTQLAKELQSGTKIIITTLQKFPFVLSKVGELADRRYAVIVDEAHSSQTGTAAEKMREVLAAKSLEEAEREESTLNDAEDGQDEILRVMSARGRQPSISFFAFTATPKPKTLEMFDEPGADGKSPFHIYSMRQAIEEGFILNVLQNYTSYKTYFRLTKKIEDDPQLNKRKASRAIARFLSLHPYNLAQKVEVIIEHFRQVTMPKIGGKAKAMVVTSSRLHAVRYKQEVDKYLKEQKYTHIRALVAFSGKVRDEFGLEYTEAGMNGFGEKQLPDKFETGEYQLLLVADKYQTGYDQPLLHTMYIDKKLSGLRAVQTLSRLNRTYPGKADTFILDFVNEREEIQAAFQPYYEQMAIDGATDPNQLYDLKHKLDDYQIYAQSEIDNFCRIYFGSKSVQAAREQGLLHGYLDPAASRYRNTDDEQQEDFKHLMAAFIRLYSFLSQVMPFQDAELEKLYAYGRLLITKLGGINTSSVYKISDEVALEYYRLQKIEEGAIALTRDGDTALKTTSDVGTSKKEADELAALSTIINVLNDKFGTDFTPSDKLFFDQIEEDLVADESLAQQARSNTIENFKFGFDELFTGKVIDRMDQNQDIFAKIMDDPDFAGAIKNFLLKKVYERLRS